MRTFLFILLTFATWVLSVYHLGTAPRRGLSTEFQPSLKSRFISKGQGQIHQLILEGSARDRGYFAGQVEEGILRAQEESLQEELKFVLPSPFFQRALFFFSMRWFWGIENFLDKNMLDEMWGVSQHASKDFDFLADGYTRQIAYHGLHEVGQTMVDMHPESIGCTVLALPQKNGWVLGRNFDFEGGRVFDNEKILKWVFPEVGYPYVSVIWAGMVGAVTGVNANGVYISVNAAGTKDFRRIGTPSTLVLLKALQFSKTAEEAKEIIEASQMFITDIFVITQSHTQTLYRIEKSPLRFTSLKEEKPVAITNHLVSDAFKNDGINVFRREKMTSLARFERGQELVNAYEASQKPVPYLLSALRDKSEKGGKDLPIGNRKAIDSLIATHAVIFDGENETLYVSQGPSLVGPFLGYKLKESFQAHGPVRTENLPGDPLVSVELFEHILKERKLLKEIQIQMKQKEWGEAKRLLDQAIETYPGDWEAHQMLGNYYKAVHDPKNAKVAYQKALDLNPAYLNDRLKLESETKQ